MYATRRGFKTAASFITLAALCLSFLLSMSAAAAQGRSDFDLRQLGGGSVTLAQSQGRITVLAFGASWLPLSRGQVQGLKQLADDYGSKGVVLYWVSTDSESQKSRNFATDDQVRAFAAKNGLTVPVLRDPDAVVSRQFGVDQLPAVVILNRSGVVSGSPIGGLDTGRSFATQIAPRLDLILTAK